MEERAWRRKTIKLEQGLNATVDKAVDEEKPKEPTELSLPSNSV